MPVLRTQTAGMACGAEGSTRGSTRPSGRSLQTNLGDGRTQRCVSVWAFWTGACEGPGSKRADPRLVLTHRFSWVQWSKGCKTPTSYRLEGPALSRPSPVGLRSLLARWGHPLPSLWWSGCRDTWEVAGRTESHSRVWWYGGANETGWGALARPPRTVLVTPTNPLTYPRWGSEGERRDPARRLVAGPKRGRRVWRTYLRSGRGCVSSAIDRPLEPPTAAHWRERRVSVTQVWLVHNPPSPLGTQR